MFWKVWILLCGVWFMDSFAAKTITKKLMHGNHLTIRLSGGYDTVDFTPVDESEKIVLYSKHATPKRGHIVKVGDHKDFVINSVTFDDQGTYRVKNFWNTVSSVYLLKVITKKATYECVAGETLRIPFEGLRPGNVSLRFSSEDSSLTLVKRGSAVGKKRPEYAGRLELMSQSIKVLKVNVSDVGNYTLTDRLDRTASISRMILIDHREEKSRSSLWALLLLLVVPVGICCCCCCCCRKRIFKNGDQAADADATLDTVKFESSVHPPGPSPAYDTAMYLGYPAAAGSTAYPASPQPPYNLPLAMNPAMPPNFQDPVYPPAHGFHPAQPPQWDGAPYVPPAPAGFVMYGSPAPAGPNPSRVEEQGSEISAGTPLLPPTQPGVALPPAPCTDANVLNSMGPAVQFNVDVGKNSGSGFL